MNIVPPTFDETLDKYLARAPNGTTQQDWSSALDAIYAEWKTRPHRWRNGMWKSTPEYPVANGSTLPKEHGQTNGHASGSDS